MSELVLAVRPDGSAYLMHHGIKGMKWGVRKASTSGSGSLQARTISALTKMQTSAKKRPHGATHRITANPNRKRPAWINPVGDYGITSGPEPTGGADSRISQLTAISKKYTSDPIGYYMHDIGRAATKLQRAMRTNLYSPEQKIAVGQQLIGQMAGDTLGMTFGTMAGQTVVLLGATAITAAMKAKKRRDKES